MKEWWKLESKSNHLESGQEASRDLGSFIASPLSKTTARGCFWDNMGNFKYVCTKVLCLGRKKSGWFNLKWYSFENVLFCYVNVFKEEKSFSYHEINNEVDYKKATKCVWERETERKKRYRQSQEYYFYWRNWLEVRCTLSRNEWKTQWWYLPTLKPSRLTLRFFKFPNLSSHRGGADTGN